MSTPRTWRAVRVFLVSSVASFALILSIIIAPPAHAKSDVHWWAYDGCTGVPELWFHHACIHHDGCYGHHWAKRATCDSWFRNDMIAECQKLSFSLASTCAGNAYMYYAGVRTLGEKYYNSPKVAVRIAVRIA